VGSVTDVSTVFFIVGVIIALGFLGSLLLKKTGLPDILFLIVIGLFLGPIFDIFPSESLLTITPYLTTLTLMMILFEGGLNMNLQLVVRQSFRATTLAITFFTLTTMGVAVFAKFVFDLQWIEALLFGPLVAGTSSVVIIPLVSKLDLPKNAAVTLALESTETDILNVIFLLTILQAYLTGSANVIVASQMIASEFAIGIVIGFIVGVVWIKILSMIRKEEFTYMLTLGILIITYSSSQMLGGSGALAALIFGLVLGNEKYIIKILRMKVQASRQSYVRGLFKKIQRELSFLMRTSFFVFLGIIYNTSGIPLVLGIVYGIAFTVITIGSRYLAVYASTVNSSMSRFKGTMTLMCGQGLAHATLTIIVFQTLSQAGKAIASLYPVITVNVIIMTNVLTSLVAFFASKTRRMRKRDEKTSLVNEMNKTGSPADERK
jgi:cell volume regulation protein A